MLVAPSQLSGERDARPSLTRCVAGWDPWESVRAKVFEELARIGIPKREAVLLEVGNPTWSIYGFAVVVDGVVQQGLLEGIRGVPESRGQVDIAKVQNLRSYVVSGVDDGPCWFLTVWHNNMQVQVAYYGPPEGPGDTAEVIRQLAPHVKAQSPNGPNR